ncbi:MAG: hypothetical protein HRU19_32875 [Pseudobacteriovorax sp.]|nr:hypothetical protein [Pseudobacteriovorax sp.]
MADNEKRNETELIEVYRGAISVLEIKGESPREAAEIAVDTYREVKSLLR